MSTQIGLAMSETDDLRECYAERGFSDTCRSATFQSIAEHFGIQLDMPVYTPKGKKMIIRASDIWAARKKFFARIEMDQQSCRLTVSGEKLAELFSQWLLHDYSDRYTLLVSGEQQEWLQRVVMLVIARHLMETKYELYLQGLPSFVDEWVCNKVCHLQLKGSLPGELARMAHHIVKNPEQQAALIEQFYVETDERMIRHQFILPKPLPPLSEGTILPFALLLSPAEEAKDE